MPGAPQEGEISPQSKEFKPDKRLDKSLTKKLWQKILSKTRGDLYAQKLERDLNSKSDE